MFVYKPAKIYKLLMTTRYTSRGHDDYTNALR